MTTSHAADLALAVNRGRRFCALALFVRQSDIRRERAQQ